MAAGQSEQNNLHPVPILVGIIGHRDIPESDVPELEEKVRAVFLGLLQQYPDTPLVAVTSLAEGADLLGAKVAADIGIPLICPLPMEPAECRERIASPEAAAQFDDLVKKATIYVCDSHSPEPDTEVKKFARAGAAVVKYSHIVLALWDGCDSGKEAGTSYLIHHAMTGIPKDLVFDLEGSTVSPLDPVGTALIRHIRVRRKNGSIGPPMAISPENNPDSAKLAEVTFSEGRKGRRADLALTKLQQKSFRHFDRLNRDMRKLCPEKLNWPEAIHAELQYWPLVEEDQIRALGRVGLTDLRERFAMADYLAMHFQTRRYHPVGRYFLFLVALNVFAHQLVNSEIEVAKILPVPQFLRDSVGWIDLQAEWPILFYGFLILAGYVSVMLFRASRWQDRYLDYRNLAEGARVQFFWLIGGVRSPVVNYFLRKQLDELEWIRDVLRLWYLRAIIGDGFVKEASPEEAEMIQENWIRDQLKYNQRKSVQTHRRDRFFKRWTIVLIVLLILTVILQPFAGFLSSRFLGEEAVGTVRTSLAGLSALAGSLALLFTWYGNFFSYGELHKACSRMSILFSEGDRAFEPRDGIQEDEKKVLEELGRESLAEVGDWLLMHRKREVRIPR